MKFSYEYYLSNTFTFPLIACIGFALAATVLFVQVVRKGKTVFESKNIISLVLLVAMCCGLITNCLHLAFGCKLPLDKSGETQVVTGKIETIEKVAISPMYKLENENSKAYRLNIDGKYYYVMSATGVSVGDFVEVTYLNNSKFVVEIQK